jgi:hypothetical protein
MKNSTKEFVSTWPTTTNGIGLTSTLSSKLKSKKNSRE